MEYQATAKYLRVSPRKARLVADGIRRLPVAQAILKLRELPRFAARPLLDVIESAMANAKQKNASEETLRFHTIEVMGGSVMKRWHAAARGQAHPFKKRMTHIRIILTDQSKDGEDPGVEKKEKDNGTKN